MQHIIFSKNNTWIVTDKNVIGIYKTQKEAMKNYPNAIIHRKDGTIRKLKGGK